MKIIRMVVGICDTNCYLAADEETGEAFLVDPGDNADEIAETVEKEKLKIQAILLTHGHFDHILAADALRQRFQVPVYAGIDEKKILEDAHNNLSDTYTERLTLKADRFLADGEVFTAGGFGITVIETPGHTCGAVCYYLKKEGILFSGDTLMRDSYGRIDFPTSDSRVLRKSIVEKLFTLPAETVVCPGHMDTTLIGRESKTNPIL